MINKKKLLAAPHILWMILFTIIPAILILSYGFTYTDDSGLHFTLDNFKSEALNANYSAIYRMSSEYEKIFNDLKFNIINTNLLLDDKIGARQETNARYWLLKG